MAYKVKINFGSKSNEFSGYESVSTRTFKTKKEAQDEIARLKKKMGKAKNSNSTQSYSIKQTDPRISPKTKKKIATTSTTVGKKAWKFLTAPPPKKKKSAFDFFNV